MMANISCADGISIAWVGELLKTTYRLPDDCNPQFYPHIGAQLSEKRRGRPNTNGIDERNRTMAMGTEYLLSTDE